MRAAPLARRRSCTAVLFTCNVCAALQLNCVALNPRATRRSDNKGPASAGHRADGTLAGEGVLHASGVCGSAGAPSACSAVLRISHHS